MNDAQSSLIHRDESIADKQGDVSWLSGQDTSTEGQNDGGYGTFLATIDSVVMG